MEATGIWDKAPGGMMGQDRRQIQPSSNWSQLGPLIEKRAIVLGNLTNRETRAAKVNFGERSLL